MSRVSIDDDVAKADTASRVSIDDNDGKDPEPRVGTRSKNVRWYDPEITTLQDSARELLEDYSHIPADRVKSHAQEVRDRAWEIHPYPCIGGFRFLLLYMCTQPEYNEIIERLKGGEKLLDLGCCFGQELRRLVHDGVPSSRLYGFDLRPEFFELGKDLFLDRDTFEGTLMAGDVFEKPMPKALAENVKGEMSIIYAASFFHLFDRPEQLRIAKLVGLLLKPQPGSMLLGRQVGCSTPGPSDASSDGSGLPFRHNEQSWREMWEEAGSEQGIAWDVEAKLYEVNRGPGRTAERLQFCVRRK